MFFSGDENWTLSIMKVLSNPVYVSYTGYFKDDSIKVGSSTRNIGTPRVNDLLEGV